MKATLLALSFFTLKEIMERTDTNLKQSVLLCGLNCKNGEYQCDDSSLDELARLVDTAGGTEVCRVIQNKDVPCAKYFIGEGKAQELRQACENLDIDLIVFDNELSPSQVNNLEKATDCRVIDRSQLILDIFALHAKTKEGKLQVALAQLQYSLPRLTEKSDRLSRLGGGIGTRGPGETQLESDRRHIHSRIASLKRQLEEVEKNRNIQRKSRTKSQTPVVALIGYTNAGKSTLLNRLTDAGVYADDRLFATLEPFTRRMTTPNGADILFSDTVGFIRKLPHQLVEAFKSTLDELVYADLLVHVADVSSEEMPSQMQTVRETIQQLGAAEKPIITVYNKCDAADVQMLPHGKDSVVVSAKTGYGMDELLEKIEQMLGILRKRRSFVLPYDKAYLVDVLYKEGTVEACEYTEKGIEITAMVDARLAKKLDI